MRSPQEVTDEEYNDFYKTTFKAYDNPMAKVHFSLEGQVEFRAMLFCPSTVPWELSQDMFNDKVSPMKLFVKRVFISDKFDEQLLPRWLSFLKAPPRPLYAVTTVTRGATVTRVTTVTCDGSPSSRGWSTRRTSP